MSEKFLENKLTKLSHALFTFEQVIKTFNKAIS